MIRVRFSRENLGGLMIAGVIGIVLQNQPAFAQQFSNGPSGGVSFGANGPQAVLNMPTAPVSNVAQDAQFNLYMQSQAENSLGDSGDYGRTSYKTGEAPNSAGLSGNGTGRSGKQNPISGVGSNYGLTPMTNGLLAPNSVNPAGIPLYDGLSYGFNTNPATTTYSMKTGTGKLIDQVINTFGGGFITAGGPRLPAVSTGSVNIDIAPNAGH
ncbi:MAG: hypothetical protein JSS83_01020 [Cyanobacteria bacterium SZAS LIN-3]|nr:hypothetical protein [Cyanobacteria bacterium SZAS LIN-3]MBS2010040.1 hypothetical protein [Cyanobacteria bacterium SZAS TMP-1]